MKENLTQRDLDAIKRVHAEGGPVMVLERLYDAMERSAGVASAKGDILGGRALREEAMVVKRAMAEIERLRIGGRRSLS